MVNKKILIIFGIIIARMHAMVKDEAVSEVIDVSGLAGPIDLKDKIRTTDMVSDARERIAAHARVDKESIQLIANGNKISHAYDYKTIAEVLPQGVRSLAVVICEPGIEGAKKSFYEAVRGVYKTEIASMKVGINDGKLEIDVSLRHWALLTVQSRQYSVKTLIKLIGFLKVLNVVPRPS